MSGIEVFGGDSYEIIAWANGQAVVYFAMFGSYQGEWLLVARDGESYYVYKDWYGSCSGCDSYEAEFGYSEDITLARAQEFAKGYEPFVVIPRETMREVVLSDALLTVIPANIRDEYSEIDLEEAARDIALLVKIEEDLGVSAQDILGAPNAEVKQRGLKKMGYEAFCQQVNPEIVHQDGDNELLAIGDIRLVHLKDSSTARRYLLRVPENVHTVREAVAWTFGMRAEDYDPLIET